VYHIQAEKSNSAKQNDEGLAPHILSMQVGGFIKKMPVGQKLPDGPEWVCGIKIGCSDIG